MCAEKEKIDIEAFKKRVLDQGTACYRDLPWRRTNDPYAIWISEVMLQQTQVSRVVGRWERWLERFPTIEALSISETADVLEEWQGMGYNRRALSLLRAARMISESGGTIPKDEQELRALPGIGLATAAGIRAFAFDLPGVYLETNVRTVFLHELFPNAIDIPDSVIIPYVRETCPRESHEGRVGPRIWYYALLDYGAYLKRTLPNPSRRSRTHKRQSAFKGSHRQKRAAVVRALLDFRMANEGIVRLDELAAIFSPGAPNGGGTSIEIDVTELQSILEELASEGFCTSRDGGWTL